MRVIAVGTEAYATVHNRNALTEFGPHSIFAQTGGCDCFGSAAFDRNALKSSVLRERRKR